MAHGRRLGPTFHGQLDGIEKRDANGLLSLKTNRGKPLLFYFFAGKYASKAEAAGSPPNKFSVSNQSCLLVKKDGKQQKSIFCFCIVSVKLPDNLFVTNKNSYTHLLSNPLPLSINASMSHRRKSPPRCAAWCCLLAEFPAPRLLFQPTSTTCSVPGCPWYRCALPAAPLFSPPQG